MLRWRTTPTQPPRRHAGQQPGWPFASLQRGAGSKFFESRIESKVALHRFMACTRARTRVVYSSFLDCRFFVFWWWQWRYEYTCTIVRVHVRIAIPSKRRTREYLGTRTNRVLDTLVRYSYSRTGYQVATNKLAEKIHFTPARRARVPVCARASRRQHRAVGAPRPPSLRPVGGWSRDSFPRLSPRRSSWWWWFESPSRVDLRCCLPSWATTRPRSW
jgi:hypothetical protein